MSEPKGERPSRRNGNRTSNNGGMRFSRGLFGWFLFLALCAALFLLLNNRGETPVRIKLTTPKRATMWEVDESLCVTPGPGLTSELKSLLGPGCLSA